MFTKTKHIALAAFAAIMLAGTTSCSDFGNDKEHKQELTYNYGFEFTGADELYNDQGVWTGVYNTEIQAFQIAPNLMMTHQATEDNYAGTIVKSWSGFAPSRSTDKADHSDGNWMDHQWSSITGGGNSSMDYMVAYYNTQESTTTMPSDPSVAWSFTIGENYPQSVYITNTSYAYYAMLNGTPYNKAFGPEDWFKVTFIGVTNGVETGRVDAYLAKDGKIVNEWIKVDLTPLDQSTLVYCQLSSSDTGEWGMNNPAYFCVDNLQVRIIYYN